jgi:hypothetical protein
LALYAERDPGEFLQFAMHQSASDLLVVHRLLAFGFERLTRVKPVAVMQYLIGDSRRLDERSLNI